MIYSFPGYPTFLHTENSTLVKSSRHFQELLKPGPNDYLLHWDPLPPIPEDYEFNGIGPTYINTEWFNRTRQ